VASRNTLKAILAGDHHQPHAELGYHRSGERYRITVYRPDALKVRIRSLDGTLSAACRKGSIPGIWTAAIYDTIPPVYEVTAEYSGRKKSVEIDPYQFLPTISEDDLYLFNAGDERFIYRKLGANRITAQGVEGYRFAVWAPAARRVSVVGDFNAWNGLRHPMRTLGSSGVWELFIPSLGEGEKYKFEIKTQDGHILLKGDPYGKYTELRPNTASLTWHSKYEWTSARQKAPSGHSYAEPVNIYEIHPGSWRRKENGDWLSYREMAPLLVEHAKKYHFTHIEFMPVMEHPFDGSWGYQVSGYFAPSSRFGTPDDLKYLIDSLHREGIKVILDWVPAHFPKDAFALGRFDGTALYEHEDPRKGEHPDWGTYIFNYGRNEVKNFLISNAVYWLDEYQVDGLRIDAVASMLYLDYSRNEGEWIPNSYGGRENIEAIEFLKHMNSVINDYYPETLVIAEESTAFGNVSRPVQEQGLGFDYKWNMGWMNDVLRYFSKDPVHRKYHHNDITFSMVYAYSEHFILVLSHDEVVHGKGSLLSKMPGDDWQKMANFRILISYMMTHPGKKLHFMGYELAPWKEWDHEKGVEWDLQRWDFHSQASKMIEDLNALYVREAALWQKDHSPEGFEWVDVSNAEQSILSFIRRGEHPKDDLLVLLNFTPMVYPNYRMGCPSGGDWVCIFNSDANIYGGSGYGENTVSGAEERKWGSCQWSLGLDIPPLSCLIYRKR